jgi:NAD(P)-dependent dehydrogenase (short-subunit alcohol dehydrogenase family)
MIGGIISMRTFTNPGAVLITGASSGIGEACTLYLDQLGFQVIAGVRKKDDGELLKQKTSAKLSYVILDVTDPATIAASFATVKNMTKNTGLVGLVNNAGISITGPLEFLPVPELRKQLEVNVFGNLSVTQAFLPLIRQGHGRIVNISSISGRIAEPMLGPYAASKFAMEALSDSLRIELRPWKIRVSLIEPGSVMTPIWGKSLGYTRHIVGNLPPEGRQLYNPLITAMIQFGEKMGQSGLPAQKVAKTVAHALTAKRPKIRYLLGADARLKAILVKWVPAFIRDWLILRVLGVPDNL